MNRDTWGYSVGKLPFRNTKERCEAGGCRKLAEFETVYTAGITVQRVMRLCQSHAPAEGAEYGVQR